MFTGAINAQLRNLLAELGPELRGRPVYVGCSGNFTVERILASKGVAELHGNDVSLYSVALGHYLAGSPFEARRRPQAADIEWIDPFLQPGLDLLATLTLLTEIMKSAGRPELYHRRMVEAYRVRFPALHAETKTRIERATAGVHLASFTASDVVDWVEATPPDAVVIAFPPTYVSGYERLYARLDAAFDWPRPGYQVFDGQRFAQLTGAMQQRSAWLVMRDEPIPDLAADLKAIVQTGARSRPCYVYGTAPVRLVLPRQRTEPVPMPRLEGEALGPLQLVDLTNAQLNTLRSEYLAADIVPAGAQVQLGVVVGDRLAGALAFARSRFEGPSDVYMMSDFAVRPSLYPRLSKLVLAAAVSTETKAILEQAMGARVRTLTTTAFTEHAVSMKYRGVFELVSRKPGRLNYRAATGRWSLQEGLDWWRKQHGQRRSD